MIFSKKCEYAIRALTHLAQKREVCDVGEISRSEKAPYHFMAKILQELKRKGFVRSEKGVGGGFLLKPPANKVRLIDVLTAIDGNDVFSRCLYGFTECSDNAPCPMHYDWKILRGGIEDYLHSHTLAHLVTGNSGARIGIKKRTKKL